MKNLENLNEKILNEGKELNKIKKINIDYENKIENLKNEIENNKKNLKKKIELVF